MAWCGVISKRMTDTPWNFVRGNQWIQTNLLFSCHHLPSPFYFIKPLTEASLSHASGALSILLEGAGREVSSGRQNDQSWKAEGKILQILMWNDSAAFSKIISLEWLDDLELGVGMAPLFFLYVSFFVLSISTGSSQIKDQWALG